MAIPSSPRRARRRRRRRQAQVGRRRVIGRGQCPDGAEVELDGHDVVDEGHASLQIADSAYCHDPGASQADARLARGCPAHDRGIMSCPGHPRGQPVMPGGAGAISCKGGKGPCGDGAPRQSGHKAGVLVGAATPRWRPYGRSVCVSTPSGSGSACCRDPASADRGKQIYTTTVKYNRGRRLCVRRCWNCVALRQTKTRLRE